MSWVSSSQEYIGKGLHIGWQPVGLHRGDDSLVQPDVDWVPGREHDNIDGDIVYGDIASLCSGLCSGGIAYGD